MGQHIAVGEAQIFAETWGATTPKVFLLHCSLAHHGVWQPFVSALGSPASSAIDLPGHGKSSPWVKGDMDYGDLCAAACVECAPRRAHVVGHSFGAVVALRYALENPTRVSRLTLIEPVFFKAAEGTPVFEGHQTDFVPFGEAFIAGDTDRASEAFLSLWGGGMPWSALPDAQKRYIANRIHLIPAGERTLYEDPAGVLMPDRLASLDLPVDLIAGALSPAVMEVILDHLERVLPNTQRHVIGGAGHMSPLTHPKQVVACLSL